MCEDSDVSYYSARSASGSLSTRYLRALRLLNESASGSRSEFSSAHASYFRIVSFSLSGGYT